MYECKIAEKLSGLRTIKGVTQEDVAQSLSVSNKTISKWECGASMPDLPMLIELSRYYDVSTDELLGIADGKKRSTHEMICSEFAGLDRNQAVLKAYEITKCMFPAMFGSVSCGRDDVNDNTDVIPPEMPHFARSQIMLHEIYDFMVCSEDSNFAVMLLRNKANFVWLNNHDTQSKIVKFFRFLAHEDTLSVLYLIHTTTFPEHFTAGYLSEKTGIKEERVLEILNEFCSFGTCHGLTAHLAEGDVTVYECSGDGIMLSAVSLAYERMSGREAYDFNYYTKSKMIGGK